MFQLQLEWEQPMDELQCILRKEEKEDSRTNEWIPMYWTRTTKEWIPMFQPRLEEDAWERRKKKKVIFFQNDA